MKKFLKKYMSASAIVIGMFLSILILQACGEKAPEKSVDKTSYTDTVSVEAERVQIRELKFLKTFSSTLEGEEQANIISKIPERIMEIKVRVDDYVQAGQVIFELDKSGASSQYYQTQAVFLNAQRDLERMKNLYNEGAVSRQALDQTQTGYDVAKANFEAAKSTVELTSPLSGVVTAINVNIGDIANPAIVMATVANISRMKAKFNAGESDIRNFFAGQPVEIYSELNPSLIQYGKLTQISQSADIQSRTFEVRTIFPNTKDRWFKPGMFCRVNVNMKTKKGSLTVPLISLIKNNNSTGVFIVNENKAYFKTISEGMNDGKYVEIISGINPDDTVVTLGMNKLKDGTVVLINNK
jgi:RND family efflux transporter MFP subunit